MPTSALLTFGQFEQLPDAPGKRELLDGKLLEMPPAKFRRTKLAQRLYDQLRGSKAGDRTLEEAGYRLGDGWLQPDVGVMHPSQAIANRYLTGAPSLAVEILSPSNTAGEIERKLTLYLDEGADEVWVLGPGKHPMPVYRRTGHAVSRVAVRDHYAAELVEIAVESGMLFSAA